MAGNALVTLSVTVGTIQFLPTGTDNLPAISTASVGTSSTMQTSSSVSTTLVSSSIVSPSHSSSSSISSSVANASPTTNSTSTDDAKTDVVMGPANVVTIITLTSVFGITVLVLLVLLLRNWCQRRRHSQRAQTVMRSWRGGSLHSQSQSTDKLVRNYKEPPKSPARVRSRPFAMSPRGVPATVRPKPPVKGAEKRNAALTRSPTPSPLSAKESPAEDVGIDNAGLTVGSGRGGLGRLDRPAPSPPPPFPLSPTPPPLGPPVPLAAPPPRPRPRPTPRPVGQIPRASRAVGRLQPGGSAMNGSLPSLESVTSERLEQFYAPWVRDMMEQGRREVRVKAVVGQRDPDGGVGLPPPGSTVPRAAGRGG